jgi:hypothetical protein
MLLINLTKNLFLTFPNEPAPSVCKSSNCDESARSHPSFVIFVISISCSVLFCSSYNNQIFIFRLQIFLIHHHQRTFEHYFPRHMISMQRIKVFVTCLVKQNIIRMSYSNGFILFFNYSINVYDRRKKNEET